MLKRTLKLLLVFILVLSFAGCGSKSNKDGKVKVYVFEAGGCPYCEAQLEYLKGLSGYDKTFEVIQKELYVDHIEWEPGKDYELGAKVATAFYEAGFEYASYQGTPFVVISDIYAAATYSTDLEETINKAAEEGDNDIVSCFEKGNSCDIREFQTKTDEKINDLKKSNLINYIIIYVLIGLIILYLAFTRNKTSNKPSHKVEYKEARREVEEAKPKKVNNRPQKKKK